MGPSFPRDAGNPDPANPHPDKRSPERTSPDKTRARDRHDRVPSILPPIMPAAVLMVGICALLVGIVKVAERYIGPSHVDEYTALVGCVFSMSAVMSYLSSRAWYMDKYAQKLDFISEIVFFVGLIALTLVIILFAFEFI
jgi:hypothetical protein